MEYEVLKTLTLTVQTGSRVYISEDQFDLVKDYLKPLDNNKMLNKMTKEELIELAKTKSIEITTKMTNAQIIELLESR